MYSIPERKGNTCAAPTAQSLLHRVLALTILSLSCSSAWAQVTTDRYGTTYNRNDISNTSIAHHAPMWYDLRRDLTDEQKAADTFDDTSDGYTQTENGINIQVAHTYVDTVYMHKGTSIDLMLPYTINGNQMVLRNYFRWFDFRTDGTYYCNISKNGGTVYDLLTPTQDNVEAYRFGNGYVSGIFNDNTGNKDTDDDGNGNSRYKLRDMSFYYPTDEEVANANDRGFNGGDNDYYILACDVSSYKDFTDGTVDRRTSRVAAFGANGAYNEPTLSGRTIFYIIGVEDDEDKIPEDFAHHWCLTWDGYQGGANEGGEQEHYLEEYEITFPSRRTSNFTEEIVALSKTAQSYAIPGLNRSSADNGNLSVKIADNDNTAGIALSTTSLSGTSRVISFHKEGVTDGGSWVVDDGSTATILVTKVVNRTTYNIARFKLTFKEEVTPLTQTQVAGLKDIDGTEGYWWDNLTYRSPEYLEVNYKLLTSITFDYDPELKSSNLLGGIEAYYPFPIDWASSSYAFYGGLPHENTVVQTNCDFPNYGEYGIVNTCVRDTYDDIIPENKAKHTDNYWMYIDASEAPGALVRLTFDENLCQGSELFVTAWIKSLGNFDSSYDAAVLLTVMGVEIDADGKEKYTPIYRQNSSQIRKTLYLTDGQDGRGLSSAVTGKGANTNEWFQIYMSFVNDGNTDYDHYVLSVNNSCAYSNGGDYYFDEVMVYVLQPSVEMTQIYQICSTSSDEKSSMRMDIEYEAIMSRLGLDPLDYEDDNEETTAKVDFVILNEAKYRNLLANTENPMTEEEAFKAALVTFYDPNGGSHQFPTLDFYCKYDLNTEYGEEGTNIIEFDGDEGYFYRRLSASGARYLSVDCLTDMMAYTEYMILLEPHTKTDKDSAQKLEEFIALMDNDCSIKTEFFMTATTILKVNGETIDPTADYCAGQEFVISPEVTYTDMDGNTVYLDGVYFDWFFGSVEEYTAANETYGGVSLEEALLAFRTYYPDAEELSDATPVKGSKEGDFTQNHYDIIADYLSQTRYGGMNNMLVLHKSHLDMRVLNTGLELVIQPIEVVLPEDAIDICFAYVPMTLYASGDAPTLKAGFSNVNYPDDYEPCLRLGAEQFESCSANSPFIINLHGATYASEDGVSIDHLGVAEGMSMLFLVDTDDATYRERLLDKENGDEMVVGKVVRLFAKDDESNDTSGEAPSGVTGSYMQIYFNVDEEDAEGWPLTPFAVREGCYYVLTVYFQEKGPYDEGEQAVGSACWGTFPLEMKIVPEHLVWKGDKTSNWNNDSHWRRADKSELNKPEEDAYPTNGANGTNKGFVPMLFSKVVMPSGSAAELYMAGFKEGSDGMLTWLGDEDTANHDDVAERPTGNIMYDMMLHENPTIGALKTEHFRVNLCDEIHFETGAQLLHSEQLIYNKAWTDVELAQGPWLLKSTPLKDAASGDWYTKKSGRETAEYFKDITFNDDENSRLNPIVYQRNWSNEGNTIVYTNAAESKDVPAYVSTGWSSVYNDASVPYQAGEGFSIKASRPVNTDGTVDDESSLLFRFPKADPSFDASAADIGRTNAGRLLVSDLVNRENPEGDYDDVYTGTVNVSLTQKGDAGSDYYIIGNPYTAPMSMSAFMAENERIKGYWTESTYGPIAGSRDNTSWGTEDCLVEPYGAFFVTTDANDLTRAGGEVTVKFTKDMQTETAVSTTSPSSLSIRATGSGGTTSAAVAYADDATDDYCVGEDALLMEDESWKREGVPMVYSVAGDKAVSVNTLKQLTLIPIGVFADELDLYTLTFVGVSNLDEPTLVDTYEATETELSEGFTMEVEGATHGRYYIHVKTPTMTNVEETSNPQCEVSAYSPVSRTVVVSSDAGLEVVEIYSIGGMLLRRESLGGSVSCAIDGVPSGIAIVKVRTTEGTAVKKIRVR